VHRRPEPIAQVLDRGGEDEALVREAPALVDRARGRVGRLHLEIERRRAALRRSLDDGPHERRCDSAPARVGCDVEIGEAHDAPFDRAGEGEAGEPALPVGDDRDLPGDDLRDLRQLAIRVAVAVGRRGDLGLEGPPRGLDRRQIRRVGHVP